MNIKFEDDAIYLNLSKNSFVHTINQWGQLFGRFNWYTFTPIEIEFENETMTGGFEFVIMLLGLGLRFRYNYNDIVENMSIEVENEIKKIKEKR